MPYRALFAIAALSLVACSGEREPNARFVPASRSISDEDPGPRAGSLADRRPMTDRDTYKVTEERCERERRCNDIGENRRFASQYECLRFYNDLDFDAFGPRVCARGVDQTGLSGCLRSIRAEACASNLETLETLDDCAEKRVCR